MNNIGLLLLFVALTLQAQTDKKLKKLTFSGYAEVYYNHNFDSPVSNKIENFIYNHNRNQKININLAMLKAQYSDKNIRANLALMAGTYAEDNLAAEPKILRNIYEANVGLKLSSTKNLWLDVGILPSHIGWETAIGKDNLTLSRSLAADNSPYFETGAKLGYTTDSGLWNFSLLALNGWQKIAFTEPFFKSLAIGHQITYTPNAKWNFNSSSYIGKQSILENNYLRLFHNFYATFTPNKKLKAIFGLDTGIQKKLDKNAYSVWYSPNLIGRFSFNEKWATALRVEYYRDKKNIIITPDNGLPFDAFGFSANVDYQINKNFLIRTELKHLSSNEQVFHNKTDFGTKNTSFTASISYAF